MEILIFMKLGLKLEISAISIGVHDKLMIRGGPTMSFKLSKNTNLLKVGAAALLSVGILGACGDNDTDIDDTDINEPVEDVTPNDENDLNDPTINDGTTNDGADIDGTSDDSTTTDDLDDGGLDSDLDTDLEEDGSNG